MIALAVAAALASPIPVQGHAAIGAYKIRHGSFVGAVRVFGKPLSQRQVRGGCAVRWRGVEIRFYTLFYDNQCRRDSSFESAHVTGAWTTNRGLRRGNAVERLRQLFPRSSKARVLGRAAYWLARKFSQAIGDYGLAVEVVNGRTGDLVILDPQGGE